MLIQGGKISSGRFNTFSVVGAYWISCIRSFWKTTLPGVTATFSPTRKLLSSVMRMRRSPLPRSRSASRLRQALQQVLATVSTVLAQHLRVGQQEVGRAHRVDELAGVEIDLLRRLGVEPVDAADRGLEVAGAQQVGLLDEVEDVVLSPGIVLEAAVAWVLGDHRRWHGAHDPPRGVLAER